MNDHSPSSNKCNITCEWASTNRVITNPDGQVIPCCFFANIIYIAKMFDYPTEYEEAKPEEYDLEYQVGHIPLIAAAGRLDKILNDYIENKDELNLFNHDMETILNHDWFKRLEESWDDPDKVSGICMKHCSKK